MALGRERQLNALSQMYPTLLMIHSYWRWMVLFTAVAALAVSILGMAGSRPFAPLGRKAGVLYVTALDMQLVLGLLLYGASPLVRTALSNMAAAMNIQELRFFAVTLAHVGAVRARRAPDDRPKYRRMLVWYAASLVAILIGIPWWRPLLRGLLDS